MRIRGKGKMSQKIFNIYIKNNTTVLKVQVKCGPCLNVGVYKSTVAIVPNALPNW